MRLQGIYSVLISISLVGCSAGYNFKSTKLTGSTKTSGSGSSAVATTAPVADAATAEVPIIPAAPAAQALPAEKKPAEVMAAPIATNQPVSTSADSRPSVDNFKDVDAPLADETINKEPSTENTDAGFEVSKDASKDASAKDSRPSASPTSTATPSPSPTLSMNAYSLGFCTHTGASGGCAQVINGVPTLTSAAQVAYMMDFGGIVNNFLPEDMIVKCNGTRILVDSIVVSNSGAVQIFNLHSSTPDRSTCTFELSPTANVTRPDGTKLESANAVAYVDSSSSFWNWATQQTYPWSSTLYYASNSTVIGADNAANFSLTCESGEAPKVLNTSQPWIYGFHHIQLSKNIESGQNCTFHVSGLTRPDGSSIPAIDNLITFLQQ